MDTGGLSPFPGTAHNPNPGYYDPRSYEPGGIYEGYPYPGGGNYGGPGDNPVLGGGYGGGDYGGLFSGGGGGNTDWTKLLPYIGAGISALGGYFGQRQSNKAIQQREEELRRLSSPEYFLSVLSKLHPALRAQVAATYGPAVQQALDRAAAFLGPSGAGAALTTAASLAPETAAYNAAYSLAGDVQRNAISAISGTPIPGQTSDVLAGITSGVRGFLGLTEAQRLARQQRLTSAQEIGINNVAPYAPLNPTGYNPNVPDFPEEPLYSNTSPLVPTQRYSIM